MTNYDDVDVNQEFDGDPDDIEIEVLVDEDVLRGIDDDY